MIDIKELKINNSSDTADVILVEGGYAILYWIIAQNVILAADNIDKLPSVTFYTVDMAISDIIGNIQENNYCINAPSPEWEALMRSNLNWIHRWNALTREEEVL
jgi:hypothetical protein